MIPGVNSCKQQPPSTPSPSSCLKRSRGEYEGVCLNPKDIRPDDLDEEILGRMIKEAGMFYKMELERRG